MTLQVLHLAGSAVSDFYGDLSRLYAQDCLDAVENPRRYGMHVAYVTPDRRWRFPADLSADAIRAAEPLPLAAAVQRLSELRIDVAVPQMFCRPGMTSYRALLDTMGIPYIGNTPDVMALGADKAKAKAVVGAAGVAVPSGEVLRRGDRPTSDTALVEDYVELGREVRCGVLARGHELVCLPLEEYNVDTVGRPVRGYADKISRTGAGDLELVAKDTARAWIVDTAEPITQRVWDAAMVCHRALTCRHYSLFDFRIDPAGEPWFLEAGLYCSFARKSVISTMASAAGIPLDELFRTAVEEATTLG